MLKIKMTRRIRVLNREGLGVHSQPKAAISEMIFVGYFYLCHSTESVCNIDLIKLVGSMEKFIQIFGAGPDRL